MIIGGSSTGEEWRYTVTSGKRMRRGFTTGSCAAAAARAAAFMLFNGILLENVDIDTPAGIRLHLPLENVILGKGYALCAVRKDGGDDPDISNNILICARVNLSKGRDILIKGGRGVGRVTKPGLQIPVGEAAINPVPRQMIRQAVQAVLPPSTGVTVEITIPDGERLASKTMNTRLGIVGGLSILGTSGIVEPMSERAYEETLALEFNSLASVHSEYVVLVTGNFGRKLALEHYELPERIVIKIGNLVGFALDRCQEHEFKKVLLIGHIGKLIKVAAGIFNTHSRIADARFETFAARAALLGAGRETIVRLQEAVTTEEMVDILDGLGHPGYFSQLAGEVSSRSAAYLHNNVKVGTVLFNFRRGLLGLDRVAEQYLKSWGK